MKFLVFMIACAAMASVAFGSETNVKNWVGDYALINAGAASSSPKCPARIQVTDMVVEPPHADLLDAQQFGSYQVTHLSQPIYPSQQIGKDKFELDYGPSPEYDGPSCTVTSDFSKAGRLVATQKCDDGTDLKCNYSKVKGL